VKLLGLEETARGLNATITRDGEFESLGFVTHSRPHMLVFLEDERFAQSAAQNPSISCVVTSSDLAQHLQPHWGVVVAPSPRKFFYALHEYLVQHTTFYRTTPDSRIAPTALVHPSAVIAPQGVQIGDRAIIEPHVVIHAGAVIEDDVVIRAGSVLASEGFQVLLTDGRATRVSHGGTVRICRGADLHAHCSVDRGLFGGATTIGPDSTLDSHVYVAHDAMLGRLCRVGAGAVINGSTTVEDEVWIGPNATVSSEVRIGARAQISLGSVVTQDVRPGERVSGNFAIDHARFLDHLRSIR